ncbi:tetraspanin-7-like [Gouania willdenowi]|uniref:Tetraspanin n=1 Tax=Gouania willdenowi TaxID=441366 RepID=A0A8C5G6H7_GOUWI|nr:tetraspanin-7-like [Gouania willdenowi]
MAPCRMETRAMMLCLKTLLLLYSLVFWGTGVLLLAVGLWWSFMLNPYTLLISNSPSIAPFILMATGGAILLFGLFGCFATWRGRPWMLKLYAVFLALVFLIELIAGISGFIFRHEIKGTFLTTYSNAIFQYDGLDEQSLAVDDVQRRLHCCGVYNYSSWLSSSSFPLRGIPTSCCISITDCSGADLRNATRAAPKVYREGCYDLVTTFIESNMGIIAGVTFGIAFSQLIGVALACCLSQFISSYLYELV